MGRRGRSQYDKLGNTYFITSTVLEFNNIFDLSDDYYAILIDSIKFLLNKYSTDLVAYVLMPNHIHLILNIPEGKSISDFMRDFKRHTSVKIKEQLLKDDKNTIITTLTEQSSIGKYKLWMDRFDDLIITTQKALETKINYIHLNPVRAGFVKEMTVWKYSSARNYYLGDESVIEISRIA